MWEVSSGVHFAREHERADAVPLGGAQATEAVGEAEAASSAEVFKSGVPANAVVHRRANWPFFLSREDGRWYVNRAKRRSKADEAQDLGDAKW